MADGAAFPRLRLALSRGAAAGPESLVFACGEEAAGRIPNDLRAEVYAAILGVQLKGGDQLSATVAGTALDLSNQRVLRVDCERTRQDVEGFRSDDVKARLARILAFFCKCQCTPYRQGLNEVVAPIMMLRTGAAASPSALGDLPDGAVYGMLQRMVSTFLPAAYGSDSEFVGLQCALQYIRLLLTFHDPSLSRILDQNGVTPELFATPWLITLLARGHDLAVVFEVWDSLVLHLAVPRASRVGQAEQASADGAAGGARQPMPHAGVHVGPGLLHFLCVAMILRHRDAIEASVAEAPGGGSGEEHVRGLRMAELSMLVSRLSLKAPGDGESLVRAAVALAAATPDSVRTHLLEVAYAQEPPTAGALAELEASVCARVSADEALQRAAGPEAVAAAASAGTGAEEALPDSAPRAPGPPPLLVIDCRPEAAFASACLRGSFHLDPSVLLDPAMLTTMADAFAGMRGLHFAVLGAGASHAELSQAGDQGASSTASDGDAADVDSAHIVVLFLLNRGFRHVCEVRGGFAAVEEAVRRRPELARYLQRDGTTAEYPEAGADAARFDDGSSSDSGAEEGEGGPAGPDGPAEAATTAGAAGSASASVPAPGRGRAARLLQRLRRRSRASSAADAPVSATPPAAPASSSAAAEAPRRSRAGSSGFSGLRTWLAGRAAPTEVFYTSEGAGSAAASAGSPSSAGDGEGMDDGAGGTALPSSAESQADLAEAGQGDGQAEDAVRRTGLFAGLRLARTRRDGSSGGESRGSSRVGGSSSPQATVSGGAAASFNGLRHEVLGDSEAIDAQLDAILSGGPPTARHGASRAPEATGDAEATATAAGAPTPAATSAAKPLAGAGPAVKPAAHAAAGAGTGPAAAGSKGAGNGQTSAGAKGGSSVGGWRSALGSAAASVASMAASARRGAREAASAPPDDADGVGGASFASAEAASDLIDTRLSLVHKGARGAADPGGDPGSSLGRVAAHFFGLRLARVAELGEDGPRAHAVVDAEGEWCAVAAEGVSAMARAVGCRRVFADKRVERRVLVVTRRWLGLLAPVAGEEPDAARAAAEQHRGMLSAFASRAMRVAADAVRQQPDVRFRLDEVVPLAALRKMGGKKGVADLAILDFSEAAKDADGVAASKRFVLLCDDVKALVAAVRAFRK